MKKMLTLSMAGLMFSLIAFGQKTDASKVPPVVKASFAKKFPGVSVKWEKENKQYEAGFKQNGNTMSALFEEKGNLTETEMDIKANSLPAAVLSYVKEHYKGKVIKEAAKITKADGTVNYEAEVESKDVIFDSNGKFLKEVKD